MRSTISLYFSLATLLLSCEAHPPRPSSVSPPASVVGAPSVPSAPIVTTKPESIAARAQRTPSRRRALLVAINDYSASRIARRSPAPRKHVPNLYGTVRDVETMRDLLILFYDFAPEDIVILRDQEARRDRILRELENLVPARPGDVRFVHLSVHGSQLRNPHSTEPDRLDETLVPADAMAGAPDIRDKELRAIFNRILDRGALLTVMLDSCYSASAWRGLPVPVAPRAVRPPSYEAAAEPAAGPKPEDRGAVIITASQDYEQASEIRDQAGEIRGAFSWAWARAIRDANLDANLDEPVIDTFLRAQARMHAETPAQTPVFAGNEEARLRPFLGEKGGTRRNKRIVAVHSIARDGTIALQGGWANGLTKGSRLRTIGAHPVQLEVESLSGLGRSYARIVAKPEKAEPLEAGTLLEIVGWPAPFVEPLRVWITPGPESATATARALAAAARESKVRWIADPTETSPTHIVRWQAGGWELLSSTGKVERLGATPLAARVLSRLPNNASLFVQAPVEPALSRSIAIGPGTLYAGIVHAASADAADYILVGRIHDDRLEYAWVQPSLTKEEARRSSLPIRTDWHSAEQRRGPSLNLRDGLMRLGRIHGLQRLESPPGAVSPFDLKIRNTRDGSTVEDGTLTGGETYGLYLRARAAVPPAATKRYVYVFAIDRRGQSTLLFPRNTSVQDRLPMNAPEIPLGNPAAFKTSAPYGTETYFLLTTEEPFPNPWMLEWHGFRSKPAPPPEKLSPLERIVLSASGDSPSASPETIPATWSIDRYTFVSVPPGGGRTAP